jgi:hypothetical protein
MYHQDRTKTFEQLTFAEQAKSINAQIVVLQRSVLAHMRRAANERRSVSTVQHKCRSQVQRLLARI